MEILWPLILFLILVAVRTRGLRKFYHECKSCYSSKTSVKQTIDEYYLFTFGARHFPPENWEQIV